MEESAKGLETDMDISIGQVLKHTKQRKKKVQEKVKKMSIHNDYNPVRSLFPEESTTSLFCTTIEDHCRYVDTISLLCGDMGMSGFDPAEIERFSSSISFVRDWMHLNYPSSTLRFACENESKVGRDVTEEIILPSFSSAVVPKRCMENGEAVPSAPGEDFVMHAGGSVWALDWCPRVYSNSDMDILREFIAVSAHPPDSSYHKLGERFSGSGVVQVWCLLHTSKKDGEPSQVDKTSRKRKPKGRPRKHILNESAGKEYSKRPRGRPRKKPLINTQIAESLDVPCPGETDTVLSVDAASSNPEEQVSGKDIEVQQEVLANKSLSTSSKVKRLRDKTRTKACVPELEMPPHVLDESAEFSSISQTAMKLSTDSILESENAAASTHFCNNKLEEFSLPRVVLCLSHNGKVAWDVKWRPSSVYDPQRMGYLAVLLGNGALEVWEVPFPHTVQVIYYSCQDCGIDPRFLKLEPVFRCSGVKFGDRHSIPLTLEWSTSSPHDMILAGCHDGTVALWKFSSAGSSADTRPLLCFSADTAPIRAISWAPVESVSESANIIVTVGHKGLKFWDIRDPFRPLWDFPVQRIVYSLDWLTDPRCIIISLDDGTLRILSLVNGASDSPVTGSRFIGTSQQGFQSYFCSSYPIWSIQTSRLTGMVAYCGADGTALRFQLTDRAVEKDPRRNRAPHFLCGSLIEEDSHLTVFTPLPDNPFPMRKSLNEWTDKPRSIRGFLAKCGREKRAKSKNTDVPESDHLLALCYGDEVGTEAVYDSNNIEQRGKKRNGKKTLKNDQLGLVCVDENREIDKRGSEVKENEVETLPSKIVAMHRIRWNQNKGSENWLCYGGAAGILRCQKICMDSG